MEKFTIDEDIKKAETLPASFYKDRAWFELTKAKIWEKSWIFIDNHADHSIAGTLTPLVLLPEVLNEPIVLTTDSEGTVHCLSNVCTHRGKLVVEATCSGQVS